MSSPQHSGAPKGNPADMPPPRKFADDNAWHMGQPDLIVQLPKDMAIPAQGADRWVDVLVDSGLTEDRYIRGIELRTMKGFRSVHHVTTSMKHEDDADDGDNVQGSFLNEYALGKNADVFPEGAGRLIKAGTKINFNLHLHSTGQLTMANVALGLSLYPKGYKPPFYMGSEHVTEGTLMVAQHPMDMLRAYEGGVENVVALLQPISPDTLTCLGELMRGRNCNELEFV